jgi:tetratricopeptide (TPR) repeat protein
MKQIILLLAVLLTVDCFPKDISKVESKEDYILEQLQNDIREIRRDQLNYKIEKDLLKETYSSNYTTVQIIISLILGIFAILGYLGLKGIISLKREYDAELIKLKDIKGEFELKLKELTISQEKVKEQITTIDNLNEEQSKKIKILEIKEKVGSLYSQRNYQRALDYIAIGLELAQDDSELLMFRAFSLLKLRNYAESIEAHKRVISIEPSNSGIIQNLAELYLIVGQIEKYDDLVKTKSEHFKSDNNGLLTYFEAFKFFTQGKIAEMKKLVTEFIEKEDLSINKNHIGNWDFLELFDSIKSIENSNDKTLFVNFTNYLKGNMPGLQIKSMLDG